MDLSQLFVRLASALLAVLAMSSCAGVAATAAATARLDADGGGPLAQDAGIFSDVRDVLGSAGAGDHVWVEMYELGRDDLTNALAAAHRRGADVRLVTDPSVDVSRQAARRLREAGVEARFYPIDDRQYQIDHVKLLLTDRTALVGGMNWGEQSARNHDYALLTRAASVLARLRAIFLQDWSLSGGLPAPLAVSAGPVAQTAPGEEVRTRLLHAIERSRREIEAEVYTFTDPEVTTAMAAAQRRGVSVRVIVDARQEVNERAVENLAAGGVAVRRYTPPSGGLLHAKAGLFDGRTLLLGSANWTEAGLSTNHELDLETDDPASTATFAARFNRDWAAAT